MTIETMLWRIAIALTGLPIVGWMLPSTFPRNPPAAPSAASASSDMPTAATDEADTAGSVTL